MYKVLFDSTNTTFNKIFDNQSNFSLVEKHNIAVQSYEQTAGKHRIGKEDGEPLFGDYARPRGNDAASAMLMKRLRQTISDPKVTIHSLRHRMKDKLRNTGCPEAISKAILGHSENSVAANYDLKIGTDKGGLTVSATGNC